MKDAALASVLIRIPAGHLHAQSLPAGHHFDIITMLFNREVNIA